MGEALALTECPERAPEPSRRRRCWHLGRDVLQQPEDPQVPASLCASPGALAGKVREELTAGVPSSSEFQGALPSGVVGRNLRILMGVPLGTELLESSFLMV